MGELKIELEVARRRAALAEEEMIQLKAMILKESIVRSNR